mgnify:CR=1 FL=1
MSGFWKTSSDWVPHLEGSTGRTSDAPSSNGPLRTTAALSECRSNSQLSYFFNRIVQEQPLRCAYRNEGDSSSQTPLRQAETILSLPMLLASYRARSAHWSVSSNERSSGTIVVTPMLAVTIVPSTENRLSSFLKRSCKRLANCIACSRPVLGRATTNSSPPKRHAKSVARSAERQMLATT